MWKKTAAQEVRSSLTMKYVHSDLTQAVDGFRRPDLALTQDGLWEMRMRECVREELCLKAERTAPCVGGTALADERRLPRAFAV